METKQQRSWVDIEGVALEARNSKIGGKMPRKAKERCPFEWQLMDDGVMKHHCVKTDGHVGAHKCWCGRTCDPSDKSNED